MPRGVYPRKIVTTKEIPNKQHIEHIIHTIQTLLNLLKDIING